VGVPPQKDISESHAVDRAENSVARDKSIGSREEKIKNATIHQVTAQTKSNTKIIQVVDSGTTNLQSPTETIICTTCSKNVARYKCPKCSEPYCSVKCYRIHDGTDTNPNSTTIKPCTESFYKDRVLGEYHARGSEEDRMKLRGILNRMHQDINKGMDDVKWREDMLSGLLRGSGSSDLNDKVLSGLNDDERLASGRIDDGANQISDEDLAELASYLLNLDDDPVDNDDSMARLQKELMPSHLLPVFECALASALACKQEQGEDESICEEGLNLSNERNKQQSNTSWQPWWLPETNECLNEDERLSISPNLDERIISIQPLRSLTSQTNNDNLAYNILDVLYATSFAIRSLSSSNAHVISNAADLLLSQSLVLSNNAIYGSVYESMSSCVEHFVEMTKTMTMMKRNSLSWDTLLADVALIAGNRRYVLKLLFEAADQFKYGLDSTRKQVKALKKNGSIDKSALELEKKELEEAKRLYKLAIKKVEYFQSWCSSMWSIELEKEISQEVEQFFEHWTLPEPVEKQECHLESMLESMLGSNDIKTNVFDGTSIAMVESSNKEYPFRLGKELIAVSTVRKDDSGSVKN
jgi:hypothetical protein